MLQVEDIHTYYGESWVLQGVSLHVRQGRIAVVLGRNGMGKTTLVRSIIGFTPPRRGSIRFRGTDITRIPSHRISRLGIGLVPQGRRIFPSLTVREHLEVALRRPSGTPRARWEIQDVLDFFPRLGERLDHLGQELSGGEQQMLAIARALVTQPEFLLLDEPSEGLAPVRVQELGRLIRRLKEEGLSLLLVEQNAAFALNLADEVYIMRKGRVVLESPPEPLLVDEELRNRYLGIDPADEEEVPADR